MNSRKPLSRKCRRSCLETAAGLLSRRDHASAELAVKLRDRGFTEDEVSDTIEKLEESGYLSDARFAENYARELTSLRYMGNFGAVMKMRQRGVDESLARDAVNAASENMPELQRAKDLLDRKFASRGELDEKLLRRAAGLLKRKGYASETIRKAMKYLKTSTNDDTVIDDTEY